MHVQTSLMQPTSKKAFGLEAAPESSPAPSPQPETPATAMPSHVAALRPLKRALSVGRPCAATPRGMGPHQSPLPWLPLTPLSSFASRGSTAAAGHTPRHSAAGSRLGISEPGAPAAAAQHESAPAQGSESGRAEARPRFHSHCASNAATEVSGLRVLADEDAALGCEVAGHEDGSTKRKQAHPKHHVAFAAGLAAGTSTAAALTHTAAAAAAGIAAVASTVQTTSVAVQLGANALNAGTDVLLSRYQGALIKSATSVVADAVLGPTASASLRVALRQRLRATVAGASVLWFLINTSAMGDTLAQLGQDHDMVSCAKLVLHLASAGPGFMENCRELLQIGVAVGLGVSQRNAVAPRCGGARQDGEEAGARIAAGGDGTV
ncbi:hypothetical protein GPECTOR_2g1406 [Gonium pectorale]|uniref:Uncharacterized protein n=1 Tax=Gonium pectorale TaxID=33097 RepID=A0A150H1A6_GONPE|nr:hypothetical protein GPECTOR_2g1406 [Gonium pectorale]|eukprot:KXZ55855.1 hypothetical protein GPECTOR_2g1406 [Gonium pectorale]